MNQNEIYDLIGYIVASEYRVNVLKSLTEDIKVPSVIAEEINLRTNHVSNVLRELKDKDLVICLNEDAKKGRLYKITQRGEEVLELLPKNLKK